MFNIKMSTISENNLEERIPEERIPEERILEEPECTPQPRERSDTEEMMERVEEIMNNTREIVSRVDRIFIENELNRE
jgi:hypothetical protein